MCQDRTIRIVLLTYRYFRIPLLRTFLRISGDFVGQNSAFTEFSKLRFYGLFSAFTEFWSPLNMPKCRFHGVLLSVEFYFSYRAAARANFRRRRLLQLPPPPGVSD